MTVRDPSGRPVLVPVGLDVLDPFVEAGVFGSYEVQFVAGVLGLYPGLTDHEALALAVAARAPRFGHVGTDLADVGGQMAELDEGACALPWPQVDSWVEALSRSAIVSAPDHDPDPDLDQVGAGPLRPLVWDAQRLYLQRYWHYEQVVADNLVGRSAPPGARPASTPSAGAGEREPSRGAMFDSLFPTDEADGPDLQRLAARRGMRPGVSIIAGGPGTGKTYTVARLLAAAHLVAADAGGDLRVALAAPTGKAAARMGDAVKAAVSILETDGAVHADLAASLVRTAPTTVHALLGWRDRTHFRHDRHNPLPHDVVIIDETSMVSLPLMAKLLDAVRTDARLVLVGDPHQLASIEAGTVMSDVVGPAGDPDGPGTPAGAPLHGRITVLTRRRRFDEESTIAALADAVRGGDAEAAMLLLAGGRDDVRWVRPDHADRLDEVLHEVVVSGTAMVEAAHRGEAAEALVVADRIKVLAATRRGPLGLDHWTDRIEHGVAQRVAGFHRGRRWQVGRPVLVTANDRANRVFNGDTGVVVHRHDGMAVALSDGDGVRYLAPSRLDQVETWWAMTIHKSQGSEFSHAVVSLPTAGSPVLTRELLYTAVTRAKDRVTVVGSEESVRAAIVRPVARASGLRDRLWPS